MSRFPENIRAICDTPDAQFKSGTWHEHSYGQIYVRKDLFSSLQDQLLAKNAEIHKAIEDRVTWQTRWEATDKALGEAMAEIERLKKAATREDETMTDPTREAVALLLEKVTPGDWKVPSHFETAVEAGPRGRVVASAGGYSSNVDEEAVRAENIANAALIAIAPFLARAYVERPLAAEAMKQAAAERIRQWWDDDAQSDPNTIIDTLPSPSPADLDAAALARPKVRKEIQRAYIQGAMDVHWNWQPDKAPDFTEAASDYLAALDQGGAE